jgi:cation diffusion facilitator family transporter
MGDTSVVAKALATNLIIATGKIAVGLMASSAALLAEGAHSIVDSSTQVILLGGCWHGRRWSAAPYFWGLVASVNMFFIGGCFSIYEGYEAIAHPRSENTTTWLGIVVLIVSGGLEATSWMRAMRTLAQEKKDQSWYQLLRTTRSTEVKAVMIEDSTDLLGCAMAAAGIILRMVTGSEIWDGLASILIGCLLIGMAYELGAQNLRFLTEEVTT